jgi:predicted dehydrogenase
MAEPIGVGIIGGGVGHAWAAVAHIPALRALPEYEIRALSTSRRESAEAAGRAYGVSNAFDNHQQLLDTPGVDLAVVSVRVPTHLELVTAALNAGKDVYCEWPLGNGLAEAETLAALAKQSARRVVVGLQAHGSPQIRYVRDLVADGYVGRVLSTSLIGSGGVWGKATYPPYAYLDDRRNGATLITIPMGHTLHAVTEVLGEFTEVSASAVVGVRNVPLIGTDQSIERTTYDQVAVSGKIGDAVFSAHYRGGFTQGTNFLWEINGTDGVLQLTGNNGSVQAFAPEICGARGDEAMTALEAPARYHVVPDSLPEGQAYNVAQTYALFAADLRNGTKQAPDFDDAVRCHRLLDRIETSIETGQRWSQS